MLQEHIAICERLRELKDVIVGQMEDVEKTRGVSEGKIREKEDGKDKKRENLILEVHGECGNGKRRSLIQGREGHVRLD